MTNDRLMLSSREIECSANLLREVLPVCSVCGLTTSGHLFKHLAYTPIEKDNPERALTLLAAVKRQNGDEILSFQEFNGLLPVIEVFALKCLDDRCSLAAFLFPFELWATDEFLLQQPVPGCDGPTAEGYWGSI